VFADPSDVSGSLLSAMRRAAAWTCVFAFPGAITWWNAGSGGLAGWPSSSDFGHRTERTSAMIYDWQTSLRASDYYAARIVPPATVEETGWDILLALHHDSRVNLLKLASIVSVPDEGMDRWLGALQERGLITGVRHPSTDELLAMLTNKGRELLDRYFSVTSDLQIGAHS
jgi:DNA-binding MarR family transcriptional regulator